MKQKIIFIVIVSFLIGFLLGNFLPGINQKESIVSSLYDFGLVERVSFMARGEISEIKNNTITIKDENETMMIDILDDITIFVFFYEEEISDDGEIIRREPKEGSIEDIKIGLEINVFGFQERDGSFLAESISI